MSSDSSHMNFKLSWMQPSAAPLKADGKPNGILVGSGAEDLSQEMMEPILSKFRYGREDLLALMGKDGSLPEGLKDCSFYVENPQNPIMLNPLSETEMRLQQNINSSKALSALTRQDRFNVLNGSEGANSSGAGGGGGISNPSITSFANRWGAVGNGNNTNKWTFAGGNRSGGGSGTGTYKNTAPNRWSGLSSSNPGGSGGPPSDGSSYRSFRSNANNPVSGSTTNSFGRLAASGRAPVSVAVSHQRPTGVSRYRALSQSISDTSTPPPTNVLNPPTQQQDYGSVDVLRNITKTLPEVAKSKNSPPSTSNICDIAEKLNSCKQPGKSADSESKPSSSVNKPDGFLDSVFNYSSQTEIMLQNQRHQQILPQLVDPISLQPLRSTSLVDEKWSYIDPNGIVRGPFLATQLQVWYKSGYFNSTLALYRDVDKSTVTLGELIAINGNENPFIFKTRTDTESDSSQLISKLFSNSNKQNSTSNLTHNSLKPMDTSKIWSNLMGTLQNSSGNMIQSDFFGLKEGDSDIQKILEAKERMLAEEQRKLREKEEKLRQSEKERLERERLIIEKENDLKRKTAEIERKTREAQQELENKRQQMANLEMKRLEELDRMQQTFRKEQLQQSRLKEEEELRKAQEHCAQILQEQERQRLILEVEAKRKEEEDKKIRIAYEEARRLQEQAMQAANRAKEEQRQRLMEDARHRNAVEANRQKKELDKAQEVHESAIKVAEFERLELLKRQKLEAEMNAIAIEKLLNEDSLSRAEKPTVSTPWVKVGDKKSAVKTKDKNTLRAEEKPQKNLLEIQQEEERALRANKQAEANAWASVAKSSSTKNPALVQKSVWGSLSPVSVNHTSFSTISPLQTTTAAVKTATATTRTWSSIPVSQPAPIPKASSKNLFQSVTKKSDNLSKKTSKVKTIVDNTKQPDAFTLWIVKRVRELNPQIDAEVFVGFIEGIESPNEAEDYIVGYLGQGKEVKEFHREFLHKRIELRPRIYRIEKDDLSGPAVALTVDNTIGPLVATGSSGEAGNENSNGGTGGAALVGKKKKKIKGGQKIDPAALGFRVTGDPNRINVGEIDTAPPLPTRKR